MQKVIYYIYILYDRKHGRRAILLEKQIKIFINASIVPMYPSDMSFLM